MGAFQSAHSLYIMGFMDFSTRKRPIDYRFLILLLIPLGFALYIDALRAPFAYDDKMYIVSNAGIRDLRNFLNFSGARYVGFLSFALNYRISGLTPFDFHLVNVIIHIANSMLLFFLIKGAFDTPLGKVFLPEGGQRLTASVSLAFTSSVIFLTHPVETQAVTYVTQRFASLAAFFYIMAVVLYARWRAAEGEPGKKGSSRVFYVASLIAAVLAMKTKEISFTLPFAVTLYDFIFYPGETAFKRRVVRLIPFYLTLPIIPLALLSPEFFGSSLPGIAEDIRKLQIEEASALSRRVYLLTQFKVIVTYMRLLLFPVNQSLDYDYPYSLSLFDPRTFVSLLALLAVFISAVCVLRASYRRGNLYGVLFSFGIFWFFVTLAVESSIIPIQDVIFEHRVYLPSVGFIISAVSALFYLLERRAFKSALSPALVSCVILLFAAVPLSYALHKRNLVWADELTLLNDAIAKNPGKARLYYARGLVYLRWGEYIRERSGVEKPASPAQPRYEDAVKELTRAISIDPNLKEAYNNRGFALSAMGKQEEAITDFTKAVRLDRTFTTAYFNGALSYIALKKYDEAIADFTTVLRLSPDNLDAYNNRGVVYFLKGEGKKAFDDLDHACKLGYRRSCENLEKFKGGAGPGISIQKSSG